MNGFTNYIANVFTAEYTTAFKQLTSRVTEWWAGAESETKYTSSYCELVEPWAYLFDWGVAIPAVKATPSISRPKVSTHRSLSRGSLVLGLRNISKNNIDSPYSCSYSNSQPSAYVSFCRRHFSS